MWPLTLWGVYTQELGKSGRNDQCAVYNTPGVNYYPNVVVSYLVRRHKYKCNYCAESNALEHVKCHLDACDKVTMVCRECHFKATRAEIKKHVCPDELILCDCKERVKRKDLLEHKSRLCAREEIQCPLRCGQEVPRSVKSILNDRIYSWFYENQLFVLRKRIL